MRDRKTIVQALREAKMDREAHKLENCMKTGLVLRCDRCEKQVYVPLRCDLRICPACSKRYSIGLFKRYFPLVQRLTTRKGDRYTLKLLTLTVKNEGQIRDQSIKILFKKARKLINEFFNKRVGAGAVAVSEFGKNLNLHIHALVYGPFVLKERLSERWDRLTGGSFIVDIRMAKGGPRCLVNYILKYITKPCSFEEANYYAAYLKALKGVRRVHTFGIFYNIGKTLKGAVIRCACGGRFELDRPFYKDYEVPTVWKLRWFFGIPSILKEIQANRGSY